MAISSSGEASSLICNENSEDCLVRAVELTEDPSKEIDADGDAVSIIAYFEVKKKKLDETQGKGKKLLVVKRKNPSPKLIHAV